MKDPLYHDRLMDHYYTPRNYGLRSDIPLTVKGTNPLCGDTITVQMEIRNSIITDLVFEHEGCVISRAAASITGESIKNKRTITVLDMTAFDVLQLLHITITPGRIKCATLFLDTIQSVL